MDDVNIYVCPSCGYIHIIDMIDDILPERQCRECSTVMVLSPKYAKRATKTLSDLFRIIGYDFSWLYDGVDVTLRYMMKFRITGPLIRIIEAMFPYIDILNSLVIYPLGSVSYERIEEDNLFSITYVRKGIKRNKYWDDEKYMKCRTREAEVVLDSIGNSMIVFLRMYNTMNKID